MEVRSVGRGEEGKRISGWWAGVWVLRGSWWLDKDKDESRNDNKEKEDEEE